MYLISLQKLICRYSYAPDITEDVDLHVPDVPAEVDLYVPDVPADVDLYVPMQCPCRC